MKYNSLIRLVCIALLVTLLLAGCGKPEAPETLPPETTEETLPPPTIPEDGNPKDVTCKGSYTVGESTLKKAMPAVVAKVGDEKLTVEQLQLYYWLEVAAWRQSGAEGPDFSQELDTQLCEIDDTAITWQQYFLQRALDTWHGHQALVLQSQAEGVPTEEAYQPDADKHTQYMTDQPATTVLYGYNNPFRPNSMHQAWLDEIPAMLQALAEEKGFVDARALAKDLANVDEDVLEWYTDLANRGYMYFTELHYNVKPTAEDVEAWFAEHEEEYAAQGITKDGEKSVNMRHVLWVPSGEGETALVAEDGTVTCSEALWENGRTSADLFLEGWKNDKDCSEATFANMAYWYSTDLGSKYNGGLYSNVRKGQLAPVLDEWCFDEARQPGDTTVLRSDWGWHIVYFSAAKEDWYAAAEADWIAAQDEAIIAAGKALNKMKVNYDLICLGSAENTANVSAAEDLLYPDVAHERFPEVPLYLQQDYPTTRYGDYSIVTHGCGITTMAMLASYMADDALTPPIMCAEYSDYCLYNGTDGKLFEEAPAEMNFYFKKKTYDCGEAMRALEEGYIVVVVQVKGYWTRGGHYLVLEKLLDDGNIQVRDSNIFNYGKLQRHKEDSFPWSTITPKGMGYWIYEYKHTSIPACARCGDGTGAGIPDGLLLQEYLCEKCHTAMERRENYLSLCGAN